MPRQHKKLKDLEYNVFKNGSDRGEENHLMNKNTGCMTLVIGIILTIIIIVVITGMGQLGKNGPKATCAEIGCSNRPRAGSNYCWLHSSTGKSNKKRSSGTDTNKRGSDKSGGSVIGGSSSEEKENSGTTRNSSGEKGPYSGYTGSSGGGGSITDKGETKDQETK